MGGQSSSPHHGQIMVKISFTNFSLLETHPQRSLQLLRAKRGASAPRAVPG